MTPRRPRRPRATRAGAGRRAGINVGIGTDTFPHNMLEELRATALGRDDIGRLAPGAKADLVLVDLDEPAMRPVRDPLRSLAFAAAERAVRDVYVDGRQVVRDGRVLTLDHAGAAARVEEAQRRAEAQAPSLDYARRRHDEIVPLTLRRA